MADQPISGLTALTAAATGDLLEIVDVSDTTMAATGTNKKITAGQLMASPGAIGGTTPAAGSFTTLTTTTEANGISALGGAGVSKRANVLIQGTNASSASKISYVGVNAWGTDGSLEIMSGTGTTKIGEGGTGYATVSSTGLAVTGAVSATTTGKVGTTLGVGNATPSASGAGITFPATQSASTNPNTLDDWEEGTFDVAMTCGTSGTITLDPTVNRMAYTKVGRNVTISGFVLATSVSSPVGSLTMTGLPFPSYNGDEGEGASAVALRINGWEASTPAIQALIQENGTTILVESIVSGTAGNAAAYVKANSSITINATYITAT
jgi:hypothetical protein